MQAVRQAIQTDMPTEKEQTRTVPAVPDYRLHFGVKAQRWDIVSMGVSFHLQPFKGRQYPVLMLDLWKVTLAFGWSIVDNENGGWVVLA